MCGVCNVGIKFSKRADIIFFSKWTIIMVRRRMCNVHHICSCSLIPLYVKYSCLWPVSVLRLQDKIRNSTRGPWFSYPASTKAIE
jgi:hypothetical protein